MAPELRGEPGPRFHDMPGLRDGTVLFPRLPLAGLFAHFPGKGLGRRRGLSPNRAREVWELVQLL